jgi:hypothetical protein
VERGLQRLSHLGQLVADPDGAPDHHGSGHQPLLLELLDPLREQPVRELRDRRGDLLEVKRRLHQNMQDGARPAPPHQLDGLVVIGATLRRAGGLGVSDGLR